MSLSKVGLPGVRTGIVIADEAVVEALAGINAILNLATGSIGPSLCLDLVESGEILTLSRTEIRPFYAAKATATAAHIRRELRGYDFALHRPEGAFFLWLWLKGLPISADELYQRLKRRGVLVIAGHHFFPGLEGDAWRHRQECIRINYSQDDATVRRGVEIIADEVKRAYREGG
jgi:valine--pyruvate aminotransferase